MSGISERGDLDWKRDLPLTATKGDHAKRLTQQADLAMDVAVMANSGGGMIVYGVEESPVAGTSAADHVEPRHRVTIVSARCEPPRTDYGTHAARRCAVPRQREAVRRAPVPGFAEARGRCPAPS